MAKRKEPICDCGKPESQCTCEDHNHSSPSKRKSKISKPTKKSMLKSMDMRTTTPKMPSTKRDIRHSDKYFR